MFRTSLAAVAVLALGAPVSAQVALGPEWTTQGFLGVAVVNREFASSTDGLFLADVDAAYSFGTISAEISMASIHGHGYFGSETTVMGGIGYNFGNGSILYAGMPRSGYDRFGRFGIGETSRYLGLFLAVTDKSPTSNVSTRGPKREGYGLRYDSASDAPLAFSVSALRDADYDSTFVGGSGQYKMGATTLTGGLEMTQEASGDAVQAKFLAETRMNLWTFGGGVSHYDHDGSLQQTYGELSLVYRPTTYVDLTAYAGTVDDNLGGGGLQTYGLGARYVFGSGADIGASMSKFDNSKVFEISASIDF
jgi:hypothetical protein